MTTAGNSLGRIQIRDLSIRLGQGSEAFEAVRDLSLEARPGEFVCLLGPSGCGKSTLLGALAGHLRPSAGSVRVDGRSVEGPSPQRGMVFQQHTLFPWRRVRDNVAFGLKMQGLARAERNRRAMEMLGLVGLADFAGRWPGQLSGGMQQRVEIARVLVNRPRLLLMDEPFGALDAQTRLKMQTLLLDVWARVRTTVLFVTHDIDEALYLADRVLVMSPPSGTDHRRPSAGLPAPARHPAGDQRRLRAPETPLPGTARPRRRPPVAAPDPARLAAGHHPGPTADRHMTCKNATLPEILELSPRLEDADPGVRRLALIELADLELPEALPLLIAALRGDPDPGVRGEAARLLEAWEEDAVVDALCAALADPLPAVADAAAQSLGELKEPAVGRRLLPWLGHADAFVRASVLRALRELRLEESAAPALAALGDPQAAVRREAVAVLGWLRHQPALAELARLASADVDPEVRRAATGALGLSREATVLPALCAALADAQWQVREEAATTLGKLGREEAGEPLLKALADDYWQVRLRAARALGRLRHWPAREALEALLGHPIGNLRKEAALALGELADPASAQALRVAEGDGDPEVRKAVRIALAQLRVPA